MNEHKSRSGRTTNRLDYGKVNSEGLGDDTSDNPFGEGAVGGEPFRKLSTSEETIATLERELSALNQTEAEIQQQAKISSLKAKIQDKKKSISEAKGEKITLKELRNNTELRKKVNKKMRASGLLSNSESDSSASDSETESSESLRSHPKKLSKKKKFVESDTYSDSESSSSSSNSSKKRKSKKYKQKSGISAKSSDHVKFRQKYPHAYLRYEHVNSRVTFDSMEMNLFVAGELEIISQSSIKRKEREARIELLKRLMYLSSSYDFNTIKSLYAAILREIELGHKKWGDDFHYVETNIFARSSVKKSVPSNKKNGLKFKEDSISEDRIWFCPLYQKNKCLHKSKSHLMVVKGKQRLAQHICATCWMKDKTKSEHPECASTCPHCQS